MLARKHILALTGPNCTEIRYIPSPKNTPLTPLNICAFSSVCATVVGIKLMQNY